MLSALDSLVIVDASRSVVGSYLELELVVLVGGPATISTLLSIALVGDAERDDGAGGAQASVATPQESRVAVTCSS